MNINEQIKKAHDNAVSKGFYGSGYCPECKNYNDCDSEYKENSGCCDLFETKNKNIGELLMLVVSELGEALEAHRENRFSNFDEYNHKINLLKKSGMSQSGSEMIAFKMELSDSFEFELADACIRIFDMCGYLNIDLEKHISLKMKYNETREYKHGKRY